MKPYEYYAEAEDEVHHALTVSAAVAPRIAAEFRAAIEQILLDIRSGGITPARYPGTECREYLMPRFPYSIVYLDDPDAIRIVAFAHHKRRRGYWKRRLRRN